MISVVQQLLGKLLGFCWQHCAQSHMLIHHMGIVPVVS